MAALRGAMNGEAPLVSGPDRVWLDVFSRLSVARSHHGYGPNPISFSDIEAFCRLMRIPMQPHHVQLMLDLDAAWLECAYAKQQQAQAMPSGAKTAPIISKHGLTAQLFDLAAS